MAYFSIFIKTLKNLKNPKLKWNWNYNFPYYEVNGTISSVYQAVNDKVDKMCFHFHWIGCVLGTLECDHSYLTWKKSFLPIWPKASSKTSAAQKWPQFIHEIYKQY